MNTRINLSDFAERFDLTTFAGVIDIDETLTPVEVKITFNEGQKLLLRAAKYLDKRWKSTPIRHADINDKLAYDRLIWLITEFNDVEFNTEFIGTV